MTAPCPFCRPNWPNLQIVERAVPVGPAGTVAIVRPLNPVVPGHVLVIHGSHDESVAADRDASRRSMLLMAVAADYVLEHGLQANIITSVGPAATQTVLHSHVHVVPREPGDGLTLPWTGQGKPEPAKPTADEIDAELSLAIMGYDPKDRYPEWPNSAMREAYRAGWEDGHAGHSPGAAG